VRTQQGPYLSEETKAGSIIATVYDERGNLVARMESGGYGGGASGPVNRTILDYQPMPAFQTRDGSSSFAFVEEAIPGGGVRWFMGVLPGQHVAHGETGSATSVMIVGNGAASASVVFTDPAFSSHQAAVNWYKTSKQYSQLKEMLTSLRYS
jgi:hypothetical protein